MKVLTRWIVSDVLRATALVTALFVALFLFFDFIDQLGLYRANFLRHSRGADALLFLHKPRHALLTHFVG